MPKYIAKVKTNKGTRYFYDRVEYDRYRRSANANTTAITNARLNNVNASNAFINAITGKEKFTLKPSKKQPANSAEKTSDSQRAKHVLYQLPKDDLKHRVQRTLQNRSKSKEDKWADDWFKLKKYITRHKAPRRISGVISDAKYRVTSTTNR